ncbi:MAG: hypothetical protein ABIO44_12895 [Saprospiraceae bacterium]
MKDTLETETAYGCNRNKIYGIIDSNLFFKLSIQEIYFSEECKSYNELSKELSLQIYKFQEGECNDNFLFLTSECLDISVKRHPIPKLSINNVYKINIAIKKGFNNENSIANFFIDNLSFTINTKRYEFTNLIFYHILLDGNMQG